MNKSDFLRYFGKLEIVHKTLKTMIANQGLDIKYEVMYFQGAWEGSTAGGCGNDSIGKFHKSTLPKSFRPRSTKTNWRPTGDQLETNLRPT